MSNASAFYTGLKASKSNSGAPKTLSSRAQSQKATQKLLAAFAPYPSNAPTNNQNVSPAMQGMLEYSYNAEYITDKEQRDKAIKANASMKGKLRKPLPTRTSILKSAK